MDVRLLFAEDILRMSLLCPADNSNQNECNNSQYVHL